MPRIAWVADEDATGELAAVYQRLRETMPTRHVPDIMRTMSLRPDMLEPLAAAAANVHFKDGALTRAQHEMIASYVSALNRCQF